MKTNHLFSALLSLALICPGIAQETHYQRPPAVIEEVALAKLSPIIRISDNNQWALQLERSPYRSIAKLAQPELKLAGMRISPETFNTSRQAEYTGASLMNIATQEEIKIEGIPDNAVITEASFSPSSKKVALFVEEGDGVYLYTCTPEQPAARKVSPRKINATSGAEILWINDNEFITLMVPENRGEAPVKPTVPSGPIIQESTGKVMPARTYQDLLKIRTTSNYSTITSPLNWYASKRVSCTRSGNRPSTAVRSHYPQISLCYLSRQFIVRIPIKCRYITFHKSSRLSIYKVIPFIR